MSENKKEFEIDGMWVAAAICTVLAFPVGLVMIYCKLRQVKRGDNVTGQLRKIGVSVIVAGLAMTLLRINVFWGILEVAAGIFLIDKARRMDSLEKRRKQYLAFIGGRDRVSLREIARSMDIPVDQVCMEMQEMLDKGMLGSGGYIDRACMELVLDGSAPQSAPRQDGVIYAEAMSEEEAAAWAKERSAKEDAQKVEQQAQCAGSADSSEKEAFDEDDEFGQWLVSLRKVNDRIDDPIISGKIDRIETLTRRIFEVVRSVPEKQPQIRKFMSYYLPTTLKLLESYAILEAQGIEGENISASKQKIEGIMDTLIQGFEKQLDLLFSAQAMDISSDVQVLESMMAADGLKDGQFTMKRPGGAAR